MPLHSNPHPCPPPTTTHTQIGLNDVAITSEVAPFGGMKQSGLGREQSVYGLDEFLEVKYLAMGLGYSDPPAAAKADS